jgi:hypothetical protein
MKSTTLKFLSAGILMAAAITARTELVFAYSCNDEERNCNNEHGHFDWSSVSISEDGIMAILCVSDDPGLWSYPISCT